jgi:MFS family permease
MLLILPLSLALATPSDDASPARSIPRQSLRQALAEAFRHRSYVLLVLGFFTCGFQLAFITVHLPSYLVDRGLSADVGAWTVGVIGLFNIVGSLTSGWLGNRMPKRFILSFIYFGRALAVIAFITLPASAASAILFGAVTGLLWLSTVPPTSSLVALMFGTRWLAMLFGFAFFSHQVGGFLGVWLGGMLFEQTGSYNVVWWLSVFFGVASALINLPIVEKAVVRHAPAPA